MADPDTNVTTLRPSPFAGEGPSRNAKDRTAAERSKRYRRKRKARALQLRQTPVTVPPAVTTVMRHGAGIDVAAYTAAVALAGAAAWFSIRGMTVLFPGAPLAVVGMAVAMEGRFKVVQRVPKSVAIVAPMVTRHFWIATGAFMKARARCPSDNNLQC